MVGDDEMGRAALTTLADEGVNVDAVGTGERHTGVAEILIDSRGENLIAVASGANDELDPAVVKEALQGVRVSDAVVTSVLEVPVEAILAAASVTKDRGWTFILNPAPAMPLTSDLVSMCDVLTPNEHEVTKLGWDSPEDLLGAGAGSVIVTRGSQGAELFRRTSPVHHQPAFQVDVTDTTGAGDTFTGSLAWALASGSDLPVAVRTAAACAGLATRGKGARTSMPTQPELRALLDATE
jgi:ribokinase